MKYPLSSVTDYTEPWLTSNCPQTGTVHSVYDGAVNLTADGQIIALQPAGSPVSPLTIRCDFPLSALDVSPGDAFAIGCGQIRFENAAPASIDDIPVIRTRLAPDADAAPAVYRKGGAHACRRAAKAYRRQALDTLRHCQNIQSGFRPLFTGDVGSDMLFLSAAEDILMRASDAFTARDYHDFAAALRELAGLGPGLTPSGDDFICGVFAAFRATGAWYHPAVAPLIHDLTHLGERTHPLSAAFINCAAEGYVSQIILNFCTSDQSIFNPADMAGEFERIGHSSGVDSLCGMAYALKLLSGRS